MEYLSLNDWITSSGKYPDRAKSEDLTDEVKSNACKLIVQVNAFLSELSWEGSVKVSSGFRPTAVNSTIKHAAKRSLHITGLAIDIADPDGTLDETIKAKPELLEKFGLWLESPDHTPGWTHLDLGTRSARAIRIFLP